MTSQLPDDAAPIARSEAVFDLANPEALILTGDDQNTVNNSHVDP